MHTADVCDFFVSPNIKTQSNLLLWLNVQKLEVFQLRRGGGSEEAPLTTRPGRLSFAYCCINTVSLLYDIVYHFGHSCDRFIVSIRSGKLSFCNWRSQGILLQKTCRNPECGLIWMYTEENCPVEAKYLIKFRMYVCQGWVFSKSRPVVFMAIARQVAFEAKMLKDSSQGPHPWLVWLACFYLCLDQTNFRCVDVMFRLYSQLEEVKQQKANEERQKIYAQNREKRKEFEKVCYQ